MFKFFKKKKKLEDNPKNLKLISLCLAFEVANADNDINESEKEIILKKIKELLSTEALTEKEILRLISEESEKRISFYDIIYDINQNLNLNEKISVLKMMWEIAYADNVLDVDEEKIIRRSAEMLGIKPSIVLKTKEEFKNQ
tara:strand:- start:150 stop:575 length:426 start_codon:yes stop_codon:yes gene_type:complete